MQLVKRRSHWSRVGFQHYVAGVFIKKGNLDPNRQNNQVRSGRCTINQGSQWLPMLGEKKGTDSLSLPISWSHSSSFQNCKTIEFVCGTLLWCVCTQSLYSCPTLCNRRTIARQAPLSMGFSKQEYWSGWCLPSGYLPDPGTEPTSPALQADSLPLSHGRSPLYHGSPRKWMQRPWLCSWLSHRKQAITLATLG